MLEECIATGWNVIHFSVAIGKLIFLTLVREDVRLYNTTINIYKSCMASSVIWLGSVDSTSLDPKGALTVVLSSFQYVTASQSMEKEIMWFLSSNCMWCNTLNLFPCPNGSQSSWHCPRWSLISSHPFLLQLQYLTMGKLGLKLFGLSKYCS